MPGWLPYLDLICAAIASALWYARPELGPAPLLLVLAPWTLRWVLTGRLSRPTPLDLPLLFFIMTAVMGLWAAFHPETAWSKFWIIVGSIAIYYAVANQPDGRHLRAFSLAFALFGGVVVVYFLWTNNWIHGQAKIESLTRIGEAIQAALPPLVAHQMQPNVVAGLLVMIVPFQIALLLDRSGGGWRWLMAFALVLAALGLLLTTSRGAWLALGIGLGIWILWQARTRIASRPWPSTQTLRLAALLAIIAILLGGLLLLVPNGPQRLLALVPGQNQLPSRALLWSRALFLIQDLPFTGGGLGSFPALDSAYVFPIWRWAQYRADIFVPNYHSHNLWLDVAVEQGLLGLTALLWLQVTFVIMVCRGWRAANAPGEVDPWTRLLFQAAVVSALVLAIHALVDDVPYGSRAMLLSLAPLGVVAALTPPAVRQSRPAVWALALPVLLILLSALALAFQRPLLAAWQADLGAVAQAKVELAGYLDEDWDLAGVRAGADWSQAASRFERSLAADPEQAAANLRLGLIRLGQGDHEGAIPLLELAFARQPRRQAARQALAEAYLLAGRLEESTVLWDGVDDAGAKLERLALSYRKKGEEDQADALLWVRENLSE